MEGDWFGRNGDVGILGGVVESGLQSRELDGSGLERADSVAETFSIGNGLRFDGVVVDAEKIRSEILESAGRRAEVCGRDVAGQFDGERERVADLTRRSVERCFYGKRAADSAGKSRWASLLGGRGYVDRKGGCGDVDFAHDGATLAVDIGDDGTLNLDGAEREFAFNGRRERQGERIDPPIGSVHEFGRRGEAELERGRMERIDIEKRAKLRRTGIRIDGESGISTGGSGDERTEQIVWIWLVKTISFWEIEKIALNVERIGRVNWFKILIRGGEGAKSDRKFQLERSVNDGGRRVGRKSCENIVAGLKLNHADRFFGGRDRSLRGG